MKFCNSCGAEVADNAKTCPKCGHVFASKSEAPSERTWAKVIGIISLVFSIIGLLLGLLSLIPLIGYVLLYPLLIIGGLSLIGSIVSCVFATHKGVSITAIVFSSIDLIIGVIKLLILFGVVAAAAA